MLKKILNILYKIFPFLMVVVAITTPIVLKTTKRAEAFRPWYIYSSLANGTYKRDFIGEKKDKSGRLFISRGKAKYDIEKSAWFWWQDRVYWYGKSTSQSYMWNDKIEQKIVMYVSGITVPGFSLTGLGPFAFETNSDGITNYAHNVKSLYSEDSIDNWVWELTSFQYEVISTFVNTYNGHATRFSVNAVLDNKNKNWNTTYSID